MTTSRRAGVLALTGSALLVVGLALLSLHVGQRQIPMGDVLEAFLDPDPLDPDHATVRSVRLARTGLAVLVGAALAVAGALMQSLTRNPLADPGLLGVTAGASFAIVASTWWWGAGSQVVQLLAAAGGAAAAIALVYAVGRTDPLRLVLAGTAVAAVLSGASVGIRLVDTEAFDNYRYWEVGSLAGREQLPLLLPVVVVILALVAAVVLTRSLGVLALGDDVAHGVGVAVGRTRVATLLVAMVLAAAATAVAGPIAFAGLIVPHLVRRFAGGSVAWLVAGCLTVGPALLLTADIVGRVLLPTGDVPVAIVTAVLGGPVLIWLVRGSGVTG